MKNLLLITTTCLLATTSTLAAAAEPLSLDVYNAGPDSFNVTATLITGDKEALLVDSGFTRADALRLAAKVLDSGKSLKTIFISQADPDFYFGAEVLHEIFPEAKIITTAAVHDRIKQKMAGKVGYWGPKMGSNAPLKPVLPEVIPTTSLTLDGHIIEIHGSQGILAHRPFMWIPDSKTIVGDIAVFANLHLWTADTRSPEELDAWTAQLNNMLALKPEQVIPGHMTANSDLTPASIHYSLEYLQNFRKAVKNSSNSGDVISTLQQQYPQAGMTMALDIGARVHTGEMKW